MLRLLVVKVSLKYILQKFKKYIEQQTSLDLYAQIFVMMFSKYLGVSWVVRVWGADDSGISRGVI